jgi:transposase-like protein
MSDISILPDAWECPDCERECYPVVTYDPEMRERVDAWKCPSCGGRFYRDDEGTGVSLRGVARRLGRWARGR